MNPTVTQHTDTTPDPGETVWLPLSAAARVRAFRAESDAAVLTRALQAAELQQLAMQP